ncbi:dynamin family protein [Rhizohabitans arisaemae]|uniref:dynamin family protein n=1 Tax=Rhizohabitans arisaemae TaxID=2720610 RepID=UPI0024B12941|nr:dynamin family protein [Rhizohabitans arisaemae]
MVDQSPDNTLQEIAELRERAERVLAALNAESFSDDPGVRSVRERVEQHALDLLRLAREPITIGVVGKFSVGKSLMLGTLLGRPDLLPTEQRPTTGNVTAIYLSPGEPGERTRVDGPVILHYLTRPQLSDCVRYMLDELARAAVLIPAIGDVESLRDYDPVEQGWSRLETWCRKQLWEGAVENLELRKIGTELLTLRDAHLSAGDILGGNVPVSQEHIVGALDLGSSTGVPDRFPERRLRHGVTARDVADDVDALRDTFPLIRRADYRVSVDPRVWSLTGLRDRNEVVLLDFPGLTARRSAKRDEFLSQSELRDIHTIITVFDANEPETNVPDTFYTMLERHGRDRAELRESILAVGNRFDLIKPPSVPESGPLTMADLTGGSQKLLGLYNGACDLVRKQEERVRFVSSIVAMNNSDLPAVFHGEEGEQILAAKEKAGERADLWKQLATRLVQTEPGSPWGHTLAAFAEDGGFAALRRLIEDHARTHGLANKLRGMRRQNQRMSESLPKLGRLLQPVRIAAGENASARLRLGSLFDELRVQHQRLISASRVFRDPAGLRAADGEAVLGRVRDEAVTEAMRWSLWQEILQRAEDGLIRKTEAKRGRTRVERMIGGGSTPGDDTTGKFLGPYVSTYREALRMGREEINAALVDWTDVQNSQLTSVRRQLFDDDVQRLLQVGLPQLRAKFGDRDVLAALDLLTDLSWLAEPEEDEPEGSTDAEIQQSFPAYVDRAMPWHSRFPLPDDDVMQRLVRHQSYLFRLRRELANGVADAVSSAVSREIEKVYESLRDELQELHQYILGPADLRLMFPPEPPSAEGGEDEPPGDSPPDQSPLRDLLREWSAT